MVLPLILALHAQVPPMQLDKVQVLGSLVPRADTERIGGTIIIDGDELERYEGASVADVLARIAGISVNRNAGRGSFNGLFLRGADPNFTQVRLDGVIVNDATDSRGGGFDIGSIGAMFVERIEILPSAASAQNGSQAIGGVINIITRSPGRGAMAAVNFDSEGGVLAGASIGNERLVLSVLSESPGERIVGSDYSADSARLKGHWEWKNDHALQVVGSFASATSEAFGDDSGGSRYAVFDDRERRETDRWSLRADYFWRVQSGVELHGQVSHSDSAEVRKTPAVPPGTRDPFGLPAVFADTNYALTETDVRAIWEVADAHDVVAGIAHQRERGVTNGELDFGFFEVPSGYRADRETESAFVEWQWEPSAHSRIQIGARSDRTDGRATTSPRASFHYDRGPHLAFASYSEGFKRPSLYALGDPLIGNPLLDDETGRSAEFGYRWSSGYGDVGITAFESRYRNLVDFDPGPPPRLVNRSRVIANGVELSADWMASQDIRLGLRYALVDIESDMPLRERPRHRGLVDAHWRATRDLGLFATGYYEGSRLSSSVPTGDRVLNAYWRVEAGLQWNVRPDWSVTLRVDNALDHRFETSVGNEVRKPFASFQVRFGVGP